MLSEQQIFVKYSLFSAAPVDGLVTQDVKAFSDAMITKSAFHIMKPVKFKCHK